MTRIKICGLSRFPDIEAVNGLKPEFVGFVFAPKSKRYVTPERAAELKRRLDPGIQAAGVFVREKPEFVASLLSDGIIDVAQLHGDENEDYIKRLRELADKPVIKAFRIREERDAEAAQNSGADYILLDSGAGTGNRFDWNLIRNVERPYFLAGGLDPDNIETALKQLKPYAVDVSSGIETDGIKDRSKMAAFIAAVRKEDRI